MRIVDRRTFLALPANTLYSEYAPSWFGPLMIKGDTWQNDFLTQQIADAIDCNGSGEFMEKLDAAQDTGLNLEMDFSCYGRDGLFNDDQLFAVWSGEDVRKLIKRLEECAVVKGGSTDV
jgi:hypothetical protein